MTLVNLNNQQVHRDHAEVLGNYYSEVELPRV